jgi:glycosyltransferase involved in cell wall biosynthesis
MRVLYDHQIFDSQLHGGVSRYFYELLARSQGRPGVTARLSALLSNNAYLRGAAFPAPRAFFPSLKPLRKGGHITAVNRWHTLRQLRRGDFDLFHPTYYDPYFLPALGDRPFVLTVFDMVHELYPGLFKADDPTRARKARLVPRAAGLIAISESTRRDLVRLLGVPPERVRVVHLAAPTLPAPRAPTGLPERYLLFVGQRGGYKNFLPFLSAVAPLLRAEQGLTLICAGGKVFSGAERAAIERERLGDRVLLHGSPDDAGLATLYRHALAFVYPSLYEGFGIPVLEAFACGCPAVVSRTSSFPEVGGDAAVYFDPEDPASMREAVARVAGDEQLRRELVARGARRASLFSWDRTATETLECYRALLSVAPP